MASQFALAAAASISLPGGGSFKQRPYRQDFI
uniref:Uncharacterized protein n=1 Tax=Arundo donax TaxID=35708 RepID=A0A0A8ZTU6_ARUDO